MKTKIRNHVRHFSTVLAIVAAFNTVPFALAFTSWQLNTSSLSTNKTSAGSGDDGGLSWSETTSASGSYDASNTNLYVSASGSAYASIFIDFIPGNFGKALTPYFDVSATATWTYSGGTLGNTGITCIGTLDGYVATTNILEWYGECTNALSNADAAGEANVNCTSFFTDTAFAGLTNRISSFTNDINAGSIASGEGSWSYLTVSTEPNDQLCYGEFAMSWTNTYVVGSGVSSLSISASVLGIAVANVTADDSEMVGATISSYANLSGSLNVEVSGGGSDRD